MKKRSQMEIMGIAIVVVILTIVILFVIRWGVLKQPVEYKKEFAQSQIATNLVNAMLSTTTECKGLTFNELFQDCLGSKTLDCNNDGTLDSCGDYAKPEVEKIFDRTLGTWKYDYEFSVIKGTTAKIGPIPSSCKAKERKTASYPLPGGLEAKLAICG